MRLVRDTVRAEAAGALADRIVDAAVAFQGGSTQDDLVLLVLRVRPA